MSHNPLLAAQQAAVGRGARHVRAASATYSLRRGQPPQALAARPLYGRAATLCAVASARGNAGRCGNQRLEI